MQIYKDYHLMRVVFCLAVVLFWVFSTVGVYANSVDPMGKEISLDTLFSRWNKDQKAKPYFALEVGDMYNVYQKSIVSEWIVSQGIGAVYLSNGNEEGIKSWIRSVNLQALIEPIYVLKIPKIFELPLSTHMDFPKQIEVECVRDDSLVFQLGVCHGRKLKELGFDAVEFGTVPSHYGRQEWKKVEVYILGLKQAGLYFSVYENQERYLQMIGWSRVMFLKTPLALEGKKYQKSRRKLKSDRVFDGLFISNYDIKRPLEVKHNTLTDGADMLLLQENIRPVLESATPLSTQSKGAVRRVVKNYYSIWKKLKYGEINQTESLDSNEIVASIRLQSKTLIQDHAQLVPISDIGKKEIYTLFELDDEAKILVDRYKVSHHFSKALIDLPTDWLLGVMPEKALLLVDLNAFLKEGNQLEIIAKMEALQDKREVFFFLRGNKEWLLACPGLETLIWSASASQDDFYDLIQMVFGAEKINGQLPSYFSKGLGSKGEVRSQITRLKYTNIRNDSRREFVLSKIDSIVTASIQNHEIPGCQIMMVHRGEVVYDKVFGYLSYDSLAQVNWRNLYDLASVTKTTVTVPMVMHAVENNLVSTDRFLGEYIEELGASNKSQIPVSLLLNHTSGLKSYHPFWKNATYDPMGNTFYYKQQMKDKKTSFDYLAINWEDTVNAWIAHSEFNSLQNADGTFRYLYSDLNFMILKQIVERKTRVPIDLLSDSLVFRPMAMDFTGFNPIPRIDPALIAPTEDDKYMIGRLLRGEVHDKNAALLGGVSGHAGLFSNANDMAKYMQMTMNFGNYGGTRFFDSLTVKSFVEKTDVNNRRSLGWDKPNPSIQIASKYASDESFGHSGFTGTLVWADPKHELIYIFLSNRIHPDPQNYKLIQNNTRTRVHDIMYESILSNDNKPIQGM